MKGAKHLIGENIRKHRLENNFSQEKLADMCVLHRTYIGSVERGERNISLENIVLISRALSVPPSVLLEGIR